jgi:hypothetical protein
MMNYREMYESIIASNEARERQSHRRGIAAQLLAGMLANPSVRDEGAQAAELVDLAVLFADALLERTK